MMVITVAGERKELNDGLTIAELIRQEGLEQPEYVTVSLNDEFIEQEERDSVELKNGDSIEFLYFMGGGC